MITITFESTTMENLIRQITAFVEKVEVKEKKRGKHETSKADCGCDCHLGQGKHQPVSGNGQGADG